ncbi:hypothetical protein DH2020_020631 [Rehmannia glutinosa]|uniref:NADP-dependent oxidoreductase domain-containing protein n=1 Tax=Rehmannia glutinosa TaxID=99300 RepID=A0ABR0WGS0_REHGL
MAGQNSMPRVKLGSQGLEAEEQIMRPKCSKNFSTISATFFNICSTHFDKSVSKLGYGCMGLTGPYNAPVSLEDGITILKEAFKQGITFFDTADIYGIDSANEYLVGKALKQLPREEIQVATKFGFYALKRPDVIIKGSPEYARSCCEASLKRLQVDYIDLYYIHRIDTTIPIEETQFHPRFTGENWEKNKTIYFRLEELSKKYNCSPSQLALSWVLHQGADVVPIPGEIVVYLLILSGTTKIKNLHDNIGSVNVNLTSDDLEELCEAVPIQEVAGKNHDEVFYKVSWRFANTPQPKAK